jgi:hypothetical protein
MKAITIQNLTRNITAREVVIMSFISNIMIKANDIRKSSVESKRKNSDQDYGLNLYKALEFSKDNSSKTGHNQHFELICNRLV